MSIPNYAVISGNSTFHMSKIDIPPYRKNLTNAKWQHILEYAFSVNQSFILTSHLPNDERSKQDIIAIHPFLFFTVFPNRIEVINQAGNQENIAISFFDWLNQFDFHISNNGLSSGGIFLTIAYEFASLIETEQFVTKHISDDTPLIIGMIPQDIFVRNIKTNEIEHYTTNEKHWKVPVVRNKNNRIPYLLDFQPQITKHEFIQTVKRLKMNIENGETYEVNFTYPCKGNLSHRNDFKVWKLLIDNTPSAFFSYVRNFNFSIISSSPERFFKLENKNLTVQPMKGTRKRTQESNIEEVINELQSNEKDRAENVMIVDLMRNDLSKIAEIGSVKVLRLFDIEVYKTVFQMTSLISCILKPNTTRSDIIKALFPPGSMTGAPKIETMKIITKNELSPREFYSGICGYFSFGGTAEFSVLIRCLEMDGTHVKANFGGAIVADSNDESEFEETLIKMSGILSALKNDAQST